MWGRLWFLVLTDLYLFCTLYKCFSSIYCAEQVNSCSVWSFFYSICRKYLVLKPTPPALLVSYVLNSVCLCELNIAQSLQVPWDTPFFQGRAVGEVVQGTACPCCWWGVTWQMCWSCEDVICEQQETGPCVWRMCLCTWRDGEVQKSPELWVSC